MTSELPARVLLSDFHHPLLNTTLPRVEADGSPCRPGCRPSSTTARRTSGALGLRDVIEEQPGRYDRSSTLFQRLARGQPVREDRVRRLLGSTFDAYFGDLDRLRVFAELDAAFP